MNYKKMQREINVYGYQYSFNRFMLTLAGMIATIAVTGYIYRLSLVSILSLVIIGVLCVPIVISSQYKYMHERQRFADCSDYLEQMLYSFKKRPKIREALKDTQTLIEGELNRIIGETVDYIDNEYSEHLYEDAFSIIEKKYGCHKMRVVHTFLIKVEERGGNYDTSANILLEDIQEWTKRTYNYQKSRNGVKGKLIVSIIMSLIICGVLTLSMPKEFGITESVIYQISTTIVLALLFVTYVIVHTKLNGNWLEEWETEDEKTVGDYNKVVNYKECTKKTRYVWIAVLTGGAIMALCMGQKIIALCISVLIFQMYRRPVTAVKNAKKRIERRLERDFPVWLREVAINIQTDTVQGAIVNSYDKAPVVLKPFLEELINDLDEDSVSFAPWQNFMKDFDVPELKSAAKMFYSFNNLGSEEAEVQLNNLIERNNLLIRKSEELKNEEAVSGLGYVVVIPMAVSTVKVFADMFVVFTTFMGMMNGVLV